MKIQHLAIIFVIVMVPIILVITSYIQKQIDTITLQTSYSTKLQTATMDSIKAFQLNSINNKYSTVSDSKIRDVEASVSTFFNSIGTELGASGYSKEDLQNFIPALLYTMYDGYYIYGEYYNESLPVVDKDTGIQKKDDSGNPLYGDYQYGLKPYIYYSCRYKDDQSGNDFVVNYTLDNNITIYGTVNIKSPKAEYGQESTGKQFVALTGPLICPDMINKNSIATSQYSYIDGTGLKHEIPYVISIEYDGVKIEPEVLQEQLFTENDYNEAIYVDENEIEQNAYRIEDYYYEYVVFENKKVYKDTDTNGNTQYFWNYKNTKQYITDPKTLAFVTAMTFDGHLHSNSAATYYYDAYIFSSWVQENLGDIKQDDARELDGKEIKDFAVNTGSEKIFKFDKTTNNPLLEDSTFNENRISVIRKSIQSNLAAAIANFGSIMDYEYVLPIFTEEDWDKIVNNISVTAFMQGIPIGAKYYNNYYVITNDKNKEVVTKDSIYILALDKSTDQAANNHNKPATQLDEQKCEAHFPTCIDMIDNNLRVVQGYRNVDFEIQTVVTNVLSGDVNFYPHANQKDYDCVVSAGNIYDIDDLIAGKIKSFDNNTSEYIDNLNATNHIKDITTGNNLRKVYLTALAREKYDLYRTNHYFVPTGEKTSTTH